MAYEQATGDMNRARLRELGFDLGARAEGGVSDDGGWFELPAPGAWLVLATDTRAGPRAAASIRGSRRESGTETADDSWGSLVCTRSGEPLRVRSQASSVGVWPVTANSLVTIFQVPSILINEKKLT